MNVVYSVLKSIGSSSFLKIGVQGKRPEGTLAFLSFFGLITLALKAQACLLDHKI